VVRHSKNGFADIPPHSENPLNYAVAQRDKHTMRMVREALTHQQAILAYQPVMRASNPDKIAFYEGLIRVLDETGRVIPAGDFMALAEEANLGREIDVAALHLGLEALRDNPGLRLSINMSARSIGYSKWSNLLRRYLALDRSIGERLILEITENSAMMMPEVVANFMEDQQNQGVCFALDNFGSGQTAIRHFKDFYLDILKIDGQFVRDIANDPENRTITAALLSVAGHFDMLTVAECVETAADAQLLIDMGIDCLQGYYFSAPTVHPAWMAKEPKKSAYGR
jgi:EAL domain-containing protein (putative c-di-GMP-specific phosphodiesterase class I)